MPGGDQVGRSLIHFDGHGGDWLALAAHHALQIQIVHQPGHPITANPDAFTIELAPDLLDAVDAEVVAVYPSDLDLQLLVTALSGGGLPTDGCVVRRGAKPARAEAK